MFILPDRNVCLITPPRTASRAVHFALTELPGLRAIWVEGPEPDVSMITHHTTIVPRSFHDYRRFVVVRHPIDRLLSLWKFATSGELHQLRETWEEFARATVSPPVDRCWAWYWPISRIVEGLSASPLRFEQLARDLASLIGQEVSLPKIGELPGIAWQAALGSLPPSVQSGLQEWCRADCDLFNYFLRTHTSGELYHAPMSKPG